jgi:hypothetical protein
MLADRPRQQGLFAWAVPSLVILLCVLSTAYSLRLTLRSYHVVLLWDQWDTVEFFDRFLRGAATLSDFIAQHNEHRIAIPRLIFVLDLLLNQARNGVNYAAILLCQAIHLALFYRLIAARCGDLLLRWSLTALVALLLFSITQWENFFWGFQVQFVGVYLFYTIAAYALCSAQTFPPSRALTLLAVGLFFGACAALTMSNGAAALLCIAIVFLITGLLNRITALTAVAGIVILGSYAATFTPNPGHTPIGFSLSHPLAFIEYVAIYLGGFFSPLGRSIGWIAGVIGLAITLAAGIGLITGGLPRDRVNLTLVAIIWFVALTAAMTALGRVSFGLDQAIASRYATPSAIFWAAAATLTCLWISDDGSPNTRRRPLALAVLTIVTALSLGATAYAQLSYRVDRIGRSIEMTRASDAILSEVYEDRTLAVLFNDPKRMKNALIPILKQRQLNLFAEPQVWPLAAEVRQDRIATEPNSCRGSVDSIQAVEFPDAYILQGWAWDQTTRAPFPRFVVLTAGRRVIGYGSSGVPRWDVTQVIPEISGYGAGFIAYAKDTAAEAIYLYGQRESGTLCLIGRVKRP